MDPKMPEQHDLSLLAHFTGQAGASRHFVRAVLAGDPWALAVFRLAAHAEAKMLTENPLLGLLLRVREESRPGKRVDSPSGAS